MKIKNVDRDVLANKLRRISVILLWILIIGMPLHTMLVDKMIGSTIFSLGGIINLWRDALVMFLFFCAVYLQPRKTLLSKVGICMCSVIVMLGIFWLFSGAPFVLKTNILRIYVIPMLMVFVMYTFSMDRALYEKIVWVLFVQGVGIALFGLLQVFVLGEGFLTAIGYGTDGALHHSFYIGGWSGSQRLVGTFASPNNCALYLAQLFAICLLNRKLLKNRWKWADIGFLVILVGVIATFSRSAWVSLMVMAVVYFIIQVPNKKRLLNWKNGAILAGALAVLWLLDLIVLKSRMTKMILSSVLGVVNRTDASFMKHLEDLIAPIGSIFTNPFGFGFGTSGPIALDSLGEGTRLVESSVWLVGYDVGLFGMILYFFPYVYTMLGVFNKKDLCKRTAGYVAMVAMIIFCILPLHQNVESTFLIFLFMGLSQNAGMTGKNRIEA